MLLTYPYKIGWLSTLIFHLWTYLLKHGTISNDLQRGRNDLKRPTKHRASKKRPETTYCEQGTTWNDLQHARNDLKQPAKIDSNFMKPLYWKKKVNWRPPMSERSNRSILCLQYFLLSVHMRNDDRQKNQSKCQNKTKQSKENIG